MSNIETHVEELNQEIADQKRQLDDKAKLIKGVDKANSEMALEIAELKQLAETKNARTLERIGRIEQQEREISELNNACNFQEYCNDELKQEIAEQKSLAAHAEQRANMLQKANDALVLKNASLNSQAVNQVKMFNEKVDEIAELKAMIDEFIEEFSCFVAQHECNCGHPSCRTCKECRDAFKVLDNAVKLREGKS